MCTRLLPYSVCSRSPVGFFCFHSPFFSLLGCLIPIASERCVCVYTATGAAISLDVSRRELLGSRLEFFFFPFFNYLLALSLSLFGWHSRESLSSHFRIGLVELDRVLASQTLTRTHTVCTATAYKSSIIYRRQLGSCRRSVFRSTVYIYVYTLFGLIELCCV